MAIIYEIHYDNVGKAYIGSSLSENPNYWGTMSPRGEARMRDDHAREGLPIVRRREILWRGPADQTLLSREYALITAHRTNIPACGYNLMPMLNGVNVTKFHWDNPRGPIQSTTDCPYGVYTIHLRGEPPFWTTFTDLDGNNEEVYRGPYPTRAWNEYLAHKDKMIKLLEPGGGGAVIDREHYEERPSTGNLTPELRDEIAQHLRASSDIRGGMILRDMEQGLTVEQIAASQRTTIDNARNYVRGTEAMLCGELPTTPSMALKASRGYRYLLGCSVSPALRSYLTSCLRKLATVNPEIRVEEPFRPGKLRERARRARSDDATQITACQSCDTVHAGECA